MRPTTWVRWRAGIREGEIRETPSPVAKTLIGQGLAERVTAEELAAFLGDESEEGLEEEQEEGEVEDLEPGRKGKDKK